MTEKISKIFKDIIRSRRELTFLIIGFLIFIVLVSFLYSNIKFLVDSFNAVFDVGGSSGAVQKQIFNIKDAKSILDQKN